MLYEQQQVYDYAKARNFAPVAWSTNFNTWTVRIPTLLCPSDEEITLRPFGKFVLNSLIVALGSTAFSLTFGTLAAYAISRIGIGG